MPLEAVDSIEIHPILREARQEEEWHRPARKQSSHAFDHQCSMFKSGDK